LLLPHGGQWLGEGSYSVEDIGAQGAVVGVALGNDLRRWQHRSGEEPSRANNWGDGERGIGFSLLSWPRGDKGRRKQVGVVKLNMAKKWWALRFHGDTVSGAVRHRPGTCMELKANCSVGRLGRVVTGSNRHRGENW
jgi:hypothetical protein